MRVWIEIHVDDEVLSKDPSRGADSLALVDALARCAESRSARLSFRFREAFPAAARESGLLMDLARRGHEIGAHAHGRGLARAVESIRSCGVEPEIAVPGLVQAGHGGRPALLRQSAGLGIRVVSDHCESRAWAYEGLMGRWEQGVWVVSPTVRPPDWGLMGPRGERLGIRVEAMTRLRSLESLAEQQGAHWFGVAMHEHDFCGAQSLEPRPEALEAFADFLDERVSESLSLISVPSGGSSEAEPQKPLSDRRVQVSRLRRNVGLRVRGRRRALRRSLSRVQPSGSGRTGEVVEVDSRSVVMERYRAVNPRALLLMSHAGPEGGRQQALRPLGLSAKDVTERGFELWVYDRSGTGDSPAGSGGGLAPGNPDHREDWRAVLARARLVGLPVMALSWSSGLIPVLAACADGMSPDILVDAEGPADRWSLVPPPPSNELAGWDSWDDLLWEGLEPISLLEHFKGSYLRLQAQHDHVHGSMVIHAARMRARARSLGLMTSDSEDYSGRLDSHSLANLEALNRIFEDWERASIGID
jgi:hypothetical protein